MSLMVSRIVVGILKEQHSDHVVLTDASRVSLPHGMVLEYFPAGSRVTIFYGHNDAGEMVVKSITPSDTSHLRHLPPAARWDYTKREEMASTGEHQTHRPNPICAVCGKPIPSIARPAATASSASSRSWPRCWAIQYDHGQATISAIATIATTITMKITAS